MCLLDSVSRWDEQAVVCIASSHRNIDNPLRVHDRLGAACGIEYAAQAMAVHGALLATANQSRPSAGFLISVRGTTLHVSRLDNIAADLVIEARCISANNEHILYQFSIHAADQILLDGRAAVVVNADIVIPILPIETLGTQT